MGTWNCGPFDNDDARDFLYEAEEDAGAVEAALRAVLELDYVDTPRGARAIAAAQLVADAKTGKKADGADEEIAAASNNLRASEPNIERLVSLARAAIERVQASKSEILELWNEEVVDPKDRDAWKASLTEITTALG